MLDAAGIAIPDKARLIGGCLRLPLRVDAARLQAEVSGLPPALWSGTGGRVDMHRAANAVFLRGFAPAEGDKPIDDRPALALLPYARHLISEVIAARPLRCLLARLPAGAVISEHVDLGPYFSAAIRIHVPVVTNELTWMFCAGLSYRMRCGEVWALNNSDQHGVWNGSPDQARVHMICDYEPTPGLLELLGRGERKLGIDEASVRARIGANLPVR